MLTKPTDVELLFEVSSGSSNALKKLEVEFEEIAKMAASPSLFDLLNRSTRKTGAAGSSVKTDIDAPNQLREY